MTRWFKKIKTWEKKICESVMSIFIDSRLVWYICTQIQSRMEKNDDHYNLSWSKRQNSEDNDDDLSLSTRVTIIVLQKQSNHQGVKIQQLKIAHKMYRETIKKTNNDINAK